jgi:dipeptidyl aminopeptidase/acylaminoacyl peptidase
MKQIILFLQLLVLSMAALAQKKVLDHTVYDGWQSIGERKISADGEWVAYTIDIQEGDGLLVVQRSDSSFKQTFSRGYNLAFTNDNLFLVFKVKPAYLDTRNAKIKKKKPEDQPKDSLVILDLTTKTTQSFADVASYKMPKNAVGYLSFLKIKKSMDSVLKPAPKDSIKQKIDTLKQQVPILIEHQPEKKQKRKLTAKGEQDQESSDDTEMNEDAEGDDNASQTVQEGSNLVLYNFSNKTQSTFPFTNEYYWSENGKILLMESSASKNNKNRKPLVSIWRTVENRLDTILLGGNDFKGFAIDKNGYQISFLAERDSAFKSPQKFYKLWYWKNGDQEASVIADRFTIGMKVNWTINDNYVPNFSKSGNRLFIGTAPVKSIKDTSLVEMDLVKLDVWHYNDDYLQPYQLRNLQQEERKSYLSMYDLQTKSFIQLGDLDLPQVLISNEGDGSFFLGMSDVGKRVSMQWEGGTKKDIYTVNPTTGVRTLITKDLNGMAQISPEGKYIFWYDMSKKNYFTYNGNQIVNATKSIQTKLYDEDYDMPSDPSPYGLMRWEKNDAFFYVYDRFDIWRVDPFGKVLPKMVTGGWGRKTNTSFRYISLDPEERAIESAQHIVLRAFNEKNKYAGYAFLQLGVDKQPKILQMGAYALGNPIKADNANAYVFTKESFDQSPNLHFSKTLVDATKLSNINPQQQEYNWMTAELFTWKAYNGKLATGIVYKPENFDPKKKYPMIAYFYETLSDGLYNYLPPSPTPSRLNIPFFVSRGYIVLAPDIYYEKGYPGKGGFDYVVSGARALARKGWVDSTKMGIQGQSWGGYQVAHIITRTNLFAAAWAGAPVANMTSAYGGIRWESGMNRQFQYEKSQSRIGASLWEKTSLYIENSPLFYLKKVTTPLVIMANDNDGAVPWYQGIEMFTAMRRLDKKVWMLNYNGEAHNLVERKNRKDIQIREQQFFDWLLKGEKPAIWLKYGVPAIEKGKSWGLETSLD